MYVVVREVHHHRVVLFRTCLLDESAVNLIYCGRSLACRVFDATLVEYAGLESILLRSLEGLSQLLNLCE